MQQACGDYTAFSRIFSSFYLGLSWTILGAMFDEIPPPRPESLPSYRMALATFAAYFAMSLAGALVAWFRRHSPLSLRREAALAQVVVGGLLSGLFLLTAKSASPQANRIRMTVVITAFLAFQLVVDILQ